MREILVSRYESPCGPLLLGVLYDRLCLCDWALRPSRARVDYRLRHGLHARYVAGRSLTHMLVESQLDEYFAGTRSVFTVPLLQVGTPFQHDVWAQLLRLPYGVTRSYSALARLAGHPRAVRAVAAAVGANALSLFIPCHRIVGSDKSLGGYAGGAEAKFYLLQFEAYMLARSTFEADPEPEAEEPASGGAQ